MYLFEGFQRIVFYIIVIRRNFDDRCDTTGDRSWDYRLGLNQS